MPRLRRDPVVLRAFGDGDVDLVCSVAADPLIPLITTVPNSGTRADAVAYIARQHDRLATGVGYSFAVAEAATDQAVGQIGLWLRNLDQGRVSTGYWIAQQFRGKGYATAALRLLSAWALSFDDVARIELSVEPWNRGSWRTAESCGYQREGLLRSWQAVGDQRKDMYMYSLTRSTPGEADAVNDARGADPEGQPPCDPSPDCVPMTISDD